MPAERRRGPTMEFPPRCRRAPPNHRRRACLRPRYRRRCAARTSLRHRRRIPSHPRPRGGHARSAICHRLPPPLGRVRGGGSRHSRPPAPAPLVLHLRLPPEPFLLHSPAREEVHHLLRRRARVASVPRLLCRRPRVTPASSASSTRASGSRSPKIASSSGAASNRAISRSKTPTSRANTPWSSS
jgi:hypothetical protein